MLATPSPATHSPSIRFLCRSSIVLSFRRYGTGLALDVIPAKGRDPGFCSPASKAQPWIPAWAGMTRWLARRSGQVCLAQIAHEVARAIGPGRALGGEAYAV